MTLDEVNQKFPRMRYKQWRASREQEGLPAEGGISAAPSRAVSRAASIKDVDAITTRHSHDTGRPGSSLSNVVHPSNRPLSSSGRPEHDASTTDSTHEPVSVDAATKLPTSTILPIQEEPVASEKTANRLGSPLPPPFKESDPASDDIEDDEDSDSDPTHNAIADQTDLHRRHLCHLP